MRVSSFLLGGIAGAAAVVYFNRKAKSMMFSAFNSSNTTAGSTWKNQSKQQGKPENQHSPLTQTANAILSQVNDENHSSMH